MTKSPSDMTKAITEMVIERYMDVDTKLAGFILDDIMFELGATPLQVLEAMEHMLLWARVRIAMEKTSNAIGPRPDPADVPREEGYVYIFKSGEYFKIGSSKNPEARLNAINRSTPPGNTKVLLWAKYKVPGFRKAEKTLKDVFEERRIDAATGGVEWFGLTVDDLEWIGRFIGKWDGENKFGLEVS